jgi:SMC interacting uncharacterized protein involved in chromosome segregation
MENEENRMAAVEQRALSNTRRIETLEKANEALNRMATAIEVLATKQEAMGKNIDKLTEAVDAIEERPVKHWDGLIDKLIWAICGAAVAFLLARAGL